MTDQPKTPIGEFDVPFDEEIERAVVGAVLINPSVYLTLASFLRPSDFFIKRLEYIWDALAFMTDNGEPIERHTLRRVLQDRNQYEAVGGDLFISELMNSTPSALYAEQYGRLLERDAVRRRMLQAAQEIQQIARDRQFSVEEVISRSEKTLFDVSEQRVGRSVVPMHEAAGDYLDQIERILTQQTRGLGLPTGFKKLDALLGGLQKSDLMIFAGRPGMGKTSFMLSLALNAASQYGARILIFTLEMGVEQMVQRLVSMETGLNMQQLRTGQLDTHEQRLLIEAVGRLSTLNIFIDDSPSLTPIEMRTKCQRVKYEHGLDLIVLDYLQLMHAPGYEGNRVQEISYISRQMKELARELDVPLLSAAQLSRAVEQRADKRPQLSDLRESGSIEQDSDIVMFLYRDVVYNEATENPNQADVIVAKHRNGPTDTIPLYFDMSVTKFMDGTRQSIDLGAM
jgi:replicative DNA helicase